MSTDNSRSEEYEVAVPADATGVTPHDYEFLLEVEELDAATEDALYETHDILISSHGDVTRLTTTASGPTAVAAAMGLLDQLAVVDAKPTRFVPDLVTRAEIAIRSGVSRQAVSNWTRGERKTSFPHPLSDVAGGLWCYGDVVPWLEENVYNFSEPCRHLTWAEFSEVAPLANSNNAEPLFPSGTTVAAILNASQTDPPAALASRIHALIQHAATSGSGQRDPVHDLLELIARDATVAQRSVIVDSLPTVLQANSQYHSDPKREARVLSLSMYFTNSLGALATERDKVRIEKAIRTLLDAAVTRKNIPAISALLSSLAFSPYKVPSQLLERSVDLVGVPAYADAFLAMLATDPDGAIEWLFLPRNDSFESAIASNEAIGVFKYAILLMSKSRPRHTALSGREDRRTAINTLFTRLIEPLAHGTKIADDLFQAVSAVSELPAIAESEPDTSVLDANERAQVERLSRVSGTEFEHWPAMPSQ